MKKPYLTWPGSSVKLRLAGDKIVLKLEDDKGENYFNIIVNEDKRYPYVLDLKKDIHNYDISHMLGKGINSIEIFKRTEGHEGGTYFHGLEIGNSDTLLEKPVRPHRRIVFYGDSVTSGMGNEAADNAKDNNPSQKNHYLSYAAMAARNLNAEHHAISLSGIGFMVSWFEYIMPDIYDQVSAVGNNNTRWDFSRWVADVVVVNLGQNDSWFVNDKNRLNPTPSNDDIITAYATFIRQLRQQHPNSQFILALGSMDVAKDNKWENYVREAINRIKTNTESKRIELILFDYTGFGAHPRVPQHKANSDKLTNRIKVLMNW